MCFLVGRHTDSNDRRRHDLENQGYSPLVGAVPCNDNLLRRKELQRAQGSDLTGSLSHHGNAGLLLTHGPLDISINS